MILDDSKLDSIVITISRPPEDQSKLVTADDNQEVVAIISDDDIIVKDGYQVRLVAAS